MSFLIINQIVPNYVISAEWGVVIIHIITLTVHKISTSNDIDLFISENIAKYDSEYRSEYQKEKFNHQEKRKREKNDALISIRKQGI